MAIPFLTRGLQIASGRLIPFPARNNEKQQGQLIAWDVVNENLHFRFFEDNLGENACAAFYSTAQQLDPWHIYPNLAYMRSTLDMLGATGFPIWLTEVDVQKGPNQYLEEILREVFSHPAVEGIIMFVDKSFKNTPAGDVVDKLLDEWKFGTQETTTDDEGFTNISVFHGDYEITVQNHITNSSATLNLRVTQDEPQTIVQDICKIRIIL
ncbi:hypothetical protein PRUPE_8G145700 [Prunus persica]|uniref:GH10 domain-containing protein n=1 Tax=Prunus persica TaxID=3760 RepID=M5W094_PRUPE|nr:hypothetical protein PRUPE_8G145700 [Prunus persica]